MKIGTGNLELGTGIVLNKEKDPYGMTRSDIPEFLITNYKFPIPNYKSQPLKCTGITCISKCSKVS
jgi:hypothetical protein